MLTRSARARVFLLALATSCAAPSRPASPPAAPQQGRALPAVGEPPTQDYRVLVASESVDEIPVLRFGPGGIRVERKNRTGIMPGDVDGPHGVAVSPDGK